MRSTIYFDDGAAVSLADKRWFYIAREVLINAGLVHVQAYIQQNKPCRAKQFSENWFLKIFNWSTPIKLLGWFTAESDILVGEIGSHLCEPEINFVIVPSELDVFDTIIHEVAHAKVHATGGEKIDHGPWWKFQYHLLKDQYRGTLNSLLAKEIIALRLVEEGLGYDNSYDSPKRRTKA